MSVCGSVIKVTRFSRIPTHDLSISDRDMGFRTFRISLMGRDFTYETRRNERGLFGVISKTVSNREGRTNTEDGH